MAAWLSSVKWGVVTGTHRMLHSGDWQGHPQHRHVGVPMLGWLSGGASGRSFFAFLVGEKAASPRRAYRLVASGTDVGTRAEPPEFVAQACRPQHQAQTPE